MSERESSILVVDDDPTDRSLIERVLDKLGEVTLLDKPGEVFSYVEENDPDIVVLDALLPGTSGLELCEKIKSNRQTRDVRVVIVTGVYLQDHNRKDALSKFKADGFLTKPFRAPELQRVVIQLLSERSRQPRAEWLRKVNLPVTPKDEQVEVGFFQKLFGKWKRTSADETLDLNASTDDLEETPSLDGAEAEADLASVSPAPSERPAGPSDTLTFEPELAQTDQKDADGHDASKAGLDDEPVTKGEPTHGNEPVPPLVELAAESVESAEKPEPPEPVSTTESEGPDAQRVRPDSGSDSEPDPLGVNWNLLDGAASANGSRDRSSDAGEAVPGARSADQAERSEAMKASTVQFQPADMLAGEATKRSASEPVPDLSAPLASETDAPLLAPESTEGESTIFSPDQVVDDSALTPEPSPDESPAPAVLPVVEASQTPETPAELASVTSDIQAVDAAERVDEPASSTFSPGEPAKALDAAPVPEPETSPEVEEIDIELGPTETTLPFLRRKKKNGSPATAPKTVEDRRADGASSPASPSSPDERGRGDSLSSVPNTSRKPATAEHDSRDSQASSESPMRQTDALSRAFKPEPQPEDSISLIPPVPPELEEPSGGSLIEAVGREVTETAEDSPARFSEPPVAMGDISEDSATESEDGSSIRKRLNDVPVYEEEDFHYELKRELAKCRRVDRPLTLILIQVADMRQIVELFGQNASEPVLWHLAEQAVTSLRDVDVVGMMSSEQLIALTVFASERYGGNRVITRVRTALNREPFQIHDGLPPIIPKIRFGMSSFPREAGDVGALFERAYFELSNPTP